MSLAAVIHGPRRMALQEREEPRPAPGEVRIRVEGCGVCGSDLAVWQGRDWFDYPLHDGMPGHEAWGVVDAVGEGVPETRLEERVVGLFKGAYAHHATAPSQHAIPVPDAVAAQDLPAEAVGCAVNAFRRAGVREGDQVAVVGVGFLGALIVQLAHQAGAHVTAASRRDYACGLAKRMGAARTHAVSDASGAAAMLEDRPEGYNVVFEATGKQGPLDLAGKLVRTRGRLVIVGFHQDGRRLVDMQEWNWKGIDVINAHEREPERYLEGMRRALGLIGDGDLRLTPLITHQYPLRRLDRALDGMERREEGFLKAVVTP